jgi:hypothetical protein
MGLLGYFRPVFEFGFDFDFNRWGDAPTKREDLRGVRTPTSGDSICMGVDGARPRRRKIEAGVPGGSRDRLVRVGVRVGVRVLLELSL